MKLQMILKTALLLGWIFIIQSAYANVLTPDFVSRVRGMHQLPPAIQLDWLFRSAKADAQNNDVQDTVAQMVQDSYSNFASFDNRGRNKLLKAYNNLLTSPLLRDEQKAFLRDTIIPAVTPLVQPLNAQQEAVDTEHDARQLQAAVQSTTGATTVNAAAPTTVLNQTVPAAPNMATNAAAQNIPVAQAVTTAANPIPVANATAAVQNTPLVQTPAAVANQIPTAQANNATTIAQKAPVAQVVSAIANQAYIANTAGQTSIPVATPAVVPTNNAPALTVLPVTTSVQQAVATNLAPIANQQQTPAVQTVQAAPQSPALQAAPVAARIAQTVIQSNQATLPQATLTQPTPIAAAPIAHAAYATTTNQQLPAATQQYATAPILAQAQQEQTAQPFMPVVHDAVAPLVAQSSAIPAQATQILVPGSLPMNTATAAAPAAWAAPVGAPAHASVVHATTTSLPGPIATTDIEATIKALYTQMQAATGNTYDAQTQGTFGASLVEAFNRVVEIQSYMSQLLTTAESSALLNTAQQQYVRDVMIPNLDQVSTATPTKTLDDAVAADPKAGKGAKKAAAGKKAKKGKKKKSASKKAKKGKKEDNAAQENASQPEGATEQNASTKKGKKKLKKAKQIESINSGEKQGDGQDKKASKKKGKKKKGKKLAKPEAVTPENPTAGAA